MRRSRLIVCLFATIIALPGADEVFKPGGSPLDYPLPIGRMVREWKEAFAQRMAFGRNYRVEPFRRLGVDHPLKQQAVEVVDQMARAMCKDPTAPPMAICQQRLAYLRGQGYHDPLIDLLITRSHGMVTPPVDQRSIMGLAERGYPAALRICTLGHAALHTDSGSASAQHLAELASLVREVARTPITPHESMLIIDGIYQPAQFSFTGGAREHFAGLATLPDLDPTNAWLPHVIAMMTAYHDCTLSDTREKMDQAFKRLEAASAQAEKHIVDKLVKAELRALHGWRATRQLIPARSSALLRRATDLDPLHPIAWRGQHWILSYYQAPILALTYTLELLRRLPAESPAASIALDGLALMVAHDRHSWMEGHLTSQVKPWTVADLATAQLIALAPDDESRRFRQAERAFWAWRCRRRAEAIAAWDACGQVVPDAAISLEFSNPWSSSRYFAQRYPIIYRPAGLTGMPDRPTPEMVSMAISQWKKETLDIASAPPVIGPQIDRADHERHLWCRTHATAQRYRESGMLGDWDAAALRLLEGAAHLFAGYEGRDDERKAALVIRDSACTDVAVLALAAQALPGTDGLALAKRAIALRAESGWPGLFALRAATRLHQLLRVQRHAEGKEKDKAMAKELAAVLDQFHACRWTCLRDGTIDDATLVFVHAQFTGLPFADPSERASKDLATLAESCRQPWLAAMLRGDAAFVAAKTSSTNGSRHHSLPTVPWRNTSTTPGRRTMPLPGSIPPPSRRYRPWRACSTRCMRRYRTSGPCSIAPLRSMGVGPPPAPWRPISTMATCSMAMPRPRHSAWPSATPVSVHVRIREWPAAGQCHTASGRHWGLS